LRHTKTIENINVLKRTETGAGAGVVLRKKTASEPEPHSWEWEPSVPGLQPESCSWK